MPPEPNPLPHRELRKDRLRVPRQDRLRVIRRCSKAPLLQDLLLAPPWEIQRRKVLRLRGIRPRKGEHPLPAACLRNLPV